MHIKELEATFIKLFEEGFKRLEKENGKLYTIAEADGVWMRCPLCYKNNNGPVGTHSFICWQPHIPQDINPKPGRWNFVGTGLEDLTLVNGSSSVLFGEGGCKAHFFIKNGEIEFC